MFYVIQHSDTELLEKYFFQYDSLSKKGEANIRHAAMMEDRLLMWKGLKQKYGTQAMSMPETGNKMIIWPIEHPDKIDSLRRTIGINQKIEDWAREIGAIYDPKMELPNKK